MKQIQKNLLYILITLLISNASTAQLRNGEIVKIKNVISSKYAAPRPIEPGFSNNNIKVMLFSNADDNRFNWEVIAVSGGYYMFKNVQSNLILSVSDNNGLLDNANILQRDVRSSASLWSLIKTTKGFNVKNKLSGHLLSTTNNMLIQQSTINSNGIINREWQFETVGSGNAAATGNKILFDITLNYIAVAEATRERIDNGDCRRIFGQVSTELWELDENNEMKTRLRSYNNMPEVLYQQSNYSNPPTAGVSYYQDNRTATSANQMGKVVYNIPENLLRKHKIMLVVKTNLGSRHKDNDFASYDALKMKEEIQNTYILDSRKSRSEIIQSFTDLTAHPDNMHFSGFSIPSQTFQRTDDTHKMWVVFTCRKN